MGVNARGGLARNGAPDDVDQSQHQRSLALGFPQGREGIRGLSRLADGQDNGVLPQIELAIPELGGEFRLHGQVSERFNNVTAEKSGVIAAPATDNDEVAGLQQAVMHRLEPAQLGHAFRVVQPAARRVLDRLRLLENFLQHEVGELAEVHVLRGHFEGRGLAAHGLVIECRNAEPPGLEPCHLVVLEVHNAVRMLGERANVRRRQRLIVPDSKDDGTAPPRDDDLIEVRGVQDGDAVRALNLQQRLLHGGPQVAPVGVLDQVGQDFGVRLGLELVPGRGEVLLQNLIIFDDAVVDQKNLPGAVLVGMGVHVVRPAGPASDGVEEEELERVGHDRDLANARDLRDTLRDHGVGHIIDRA